MRLVFARDDRLTRNVTHSDISYLDVNLHKNLRL